jgi:uncharacterized membrane protein
MTKNRLEAFSDGVLAIIITVMVLELKRPERPEFTALLVTAPVLLSYVLSYLYVGIYWNNHHHLLHAVKRVNGKMLWANLHLLFWLSLFPFTTAWMGENHASTAPAAVYGATLFMAGVAYYILQSVILSGEGPGSALAQALGRDWKGKSSPVIYLIGIGVSFANPWIAIAIYAVVALMWLVPDRRIERNLATLER